MFQVVAMHKYCLVSPCKMPIPNIPKVVSTPVLYTPRVNLVAATVGLVWLTNAALKESGGNEPQTQVLSTLHSAQILLAKNKPSALSVLLNALRPFALRPWSSWDASSERTILSLTGCGHRRESVDRTVRVPLIGNCNNHVRVSKPCHDEQLNLRQRTLGHATGSPGGCHPGPDPVHRLVSGRHNVVSHAFLPQRALELYAFLSCAQASISPRYQC